MTSKHYDVVVLGRSLGALAAAALLARRDFRVLLLGQGQHGQTYHFEEHVLCRRSFTLLAGSSPTWRRILHELAQSPQFRRRVTPLDPDDVSELDVGAGPAASVFSLVIWGALVPALVVLALGYLLLRFG